MATAGCAIFTPWQVPFRRTVILVVLIVCIITVFRAPAILAALDPLLP